jgi:hypothetical protein
VKSTGDIENDSSDAQIHLTFDTQRKCVIQDCRRIILNLPISLTRRCRVAVVSFTVESMHGLVDWRKPTNPYARIRLDEIIDSVACVQQIYSTTCN